MNKKSEKGQGLVEYALILVLVAIVVIVILALLSGCWVLLFVPLVWPWLVVNGTALVVGVQAGNPTAIFVAALISLVVLWLIFGGRRR